MIKYLDLTQGQWETIDRLGQKIKTDRFVFPKKFLC